MVLEYDMCCVLCVVCCVVLFCACVDACRVSGDEFCGIERGDFDGVDLELLTLLCVVRCALCVVRCVCVRACLRAC